MKSARLSLLLTLSAGVALPWLLADDGVLPKAPPATHYDAMAARSPFTAPTAAAPAPTAAPVAAGLHWWDQMFLTSLMDRGGVYYIGLVDKAGNKHYLLETGKADQESQLLLNSVQWNDHLDQTTATVSKGGEVAPAIRFDANATSAAPAAPAQTSMAVPRPLPNGMPALPPGFSGTPPPPPPGNPAIIQRTNPIGSRPGVAPQNQPQPVVRGPINGPRRLVVPSSSDD